MRCIAVGWLILIGGCGMLSVGTFSRVPLPTEIQPDSNQKLDQIVAASGVQIYRCDRKKEPADQYEWTFQAPEATLRDTGGKHLGKHYAGPTWEANDGSKIVGTVQARHDAPDRKSIPWLRLGTRSTGTPGAFAKTTTVLRVATSGGSAPAGGCNEVELGRIVRVPYNADYNFYVPR
jgi:hypothetical protein